jgi:Protein of unknown function (DUF2841)
MNEWASNTSYHPVGHQSLVGHRFVILPHLALLKVGSLPYQMPLKPVEDYRYFVALVAVEDGTVQMRASQDLKGYKRLILEDAVLRFNEVLADYIQQPGESSWVHSQVARLIGISGSSKRHRSLTQASNCFLPRDNPFPPNPRKSAKRRHHPAFHGLEQPFYVRQELKLDGKQPVQAVRQLQIRVDDQKAQAKWFSDAFKAVQQVGCRTIAKVWIKKIHPKKVRTPLA